MTLTPSQSAVKGLLDPPTDPNQYSLPENAQPITPQFPGSGRALLPEPNSTSDTGQEMGYPEVYQPTTSPVQPTEDARALSDTLSGTVRQGTPQEYLDMGRQRVSDAANAPIEKQKKWKDFLAYGIQGAQNFFNPGQTTPIVGYGRIKHDAALRNAQKDLLPLEEQENNRLGLEQKGANVERARADALDTYTKPAREAAEQQTRIRLQQMKDNAAGQKWKQVLRNGRYFKQYGDGREEPLKNAKGEQEVEASKLPIKTTVNGQEVWTVGDKVIDRDIAEKYRQAQMNFEADKYNTEEINDYQENITKWATDEAKRKQDTLQWQNDANTKIAEADTLDAQAMEAVQRADKLKADNYDDSDARKEANKLKAEAVKARKEGEASSNKAANSKSLPMPSKPKAKLSAPNLSGRYSGQVFPSPTTLKSAFPGKSETEIRAIVEGQGGKFQ